MTDARTAILDRLRAAPRPQPMPLPDWTPFVSGAETPLARFTRLMTAVRGEVMTIKRADLAATVRRVLADKKAHNLLYGPDTDLGRTLREAWEKEPGPQLVAYDQPIEVMKKQIVNDVDAGITTTKGAIAETGSLILWPSPQEPRLLSLVPPVHIAVVEGAAIFDSMPEAVAKLGWSVTPPRNGLLISGPSKTSDIEAILCFGVHGPKQLVVLIITD